MKQVWRMGAALGVSAEKSRFCGRWCRNMDHNVPSWSDSRKLPRLPGGVSAGGTGEHVSSHGGTKRSGMEHGGGAADWLGIFL